MIESFWLKWVIFMGIIAGSYYSLKYFADIDAIEEVSTAYSQMGEMEFDWVALVLTLFGSMIFWGIMWKTPYWATTPFSPERFLEITSLHMKIFISIALPLIGYPLVLKKLTE